MKRAWTSRFIFRSALPAALAFFLFIISFFHIIIPAVERSIMEQKRTMIRELTTSAWNILASVEHQERSGFITRPEAQERAIEQIRSLHYGSEMKDYFWINDMTPRMIIHPYRTDLNGQDMSTHTDPDGRFPFIEFVKMVKSNGAGYVSYRWQYEDDPSRIVPKISYVKGFSPWGWIIGTGIYIEDVRRDVEAVTRQLETASAIILILVSLLFFVFLRQNLRSERERSTALQALATSEEKYRGVVESAGESILMAFSDGSLFANHSLLALLGYSELELENLTLAQLFVENHDHTDTTNGAALCQSYLGTQSEVSKFECSLRQKDGQSVPVILSLSRINTGGIPGIAAIASNISRHRELDIVAEQLFNSMRASLQALDSLAHTTPSQTLSGTPLTLRQAINRCNSIEALDRCNRTMPLLMAGLIQSGMRPPLLNQLITENADAVLTRCIDLVLTDLGPAPAKFSFLVLGSQARSEQTLCTDQDNAILFDDSKGDRKALRSWFHAFGIQVCNALDRAGFERCKGGIMAANEKWVMSLDEWKATFKSWCETLTAEDLLQAKIFFDLRSGYGEEVLLSHLQEGLKAMLVGNNRFFSLLARNILLFEPPLGLLGNLVLDERDQGDPAFDLKGAMAQLVDFARIYALKQGITAPGSKGRFDQLLAAGVLEEKSHQELLFTYDYLMGIRLRSQAKAVIGHRQPGNLIVPKRLPAVEQRLLREAFSQIKNLQVRLSYDFTGTA